MSVSNNGVTCGKRIISVLLILTMALSIFFTVALNANAAPKKKDGVTKIQVKSASYMRIYISHKNLKKLKNVKEGTALLTAIGLNAKKVKMLKVPASVVKKAPYVALFASVLALRYWVATKVDKGKGVYYNVYVRYSLKRAPFIFPTIGLVHAQ